jgi:hypothetical protein
MTVPSLNSRDQSISTRAPKLIRRVNDTSVDQSEYNMRNIRVDSLAINRFAISFFKVRKIRDEAGGSMMYITRRRIEKIQHCHSLFRKESVEVIGSSPIGLGCSGLDS